MQRRPSRGIFPRNRSNRPGPVRSRCRRTLGATGLGLFHGDRRSTRWL